MTIGNDNIDNRHSVITSNPVQGFQGIGTFWLKSWSGADAPKRTSPSPANHTPQRIRKDRGEHAYSMNFESGNCILLKIKVGSASPTWVATEMSTTTPVASTQWGGNDDIDLIGRLRSTIYGSDFDMSVFLGTSHQTLRMIGDTAIELAAGLSALKRGNLSGAWKRSKRLLKDRPVARTNDELSRRVLETRYGWLPLLQDLDEGARFVAANLDFPMTQRYRVSRKKNTAASFLNGPTSLTWYTRKSIVAIVTENPLLITKLGLTHPENLAWELLPWSFVADWVLPIGDYLEARSFASGLTGKFVTSRKDFYHASGKKYTQTPKVVILEGDEEQSYYRKIFFSRTISSSLNVPMPSVKPLSKVASYAHAINGIALLAQQRARIARSLVG